MARSYYICSHIDPLALSYIPGIALDTLFLVAIQALAVVVLSKFFHLFLRRYNQPSVISQILAGVFVGGMGLRNAIVHVDVDNVEDMYGGYISAARILYMFLVGLDMDIAALRHATRRCVAFTYATVAASLLLAAFLSSGMYGSMMHSPVKTPELLAATLMLALTNASSISVTRIASELKLTVTENGRLVVAAAIATNLICVLGDGVLSSTTLAKEKIEGLTQGSPQIKKGFLALAVAGGAVWLVRVPGAGLNKRNVGQHHVGVRDLAMMLLAIWFIGNIPQYLGFDGMPTSLALGMAFPREGPAARSVAAALGPPVKGVMLPFYFATIGMRMNFNSMSGAIIVPGVLMTLLGLFGKAIGAAAVAAYLSLSIPLADALRFSVLLNVKGHVDTMNMKFAKSEGVWAEQALYAMIIGNLISTLLAGPVVAVVRRKEEEAYRTRHQAIESLGAEQELRMLACAHIAHAAPGILSLVELLVSEPQEQPAVHVLHLFGVSGERVERTPYHQRIREDGGGGRRIGGGGCDAITQMNTIVDLFSRATGIWFRQIDVVSRGAALDAGAVCRSAEDLHACLLLVPCHKEQRYDGKMACRLDERRELNHDEGDVDERFLWRFYERYASRELAMYVEKVVESPADVEETLDGMAGMFSLVIVGRGGRHPPELLAGLDRWADAAGVMGPAAEILASNDSLEMGSVLVMQQHTVVMPHQ
uniref:Cation/H+ exchanger transmembrane domain-containing protein n=1 Tax=Oryza brachyantha TaxID=4533 RepID=J3MV36_ORYBR